MFQKNKVQTLVNNRNLQEINNLRCLGNATTTVVGNLQQQVDDLHTIVTQQRLTSHHQYVNLQQTIVRIQSLNVQQQQSLIQLQNQHNLLSQRVFTFLENPQVGIVLSNNIPLQLNNQLVPYTNI